MTTDSSTSDATLSNTDAKAILAVRRLLLAKEMYLHGLEHSYSLDGLSKMIAVHNFHNAIEISLRAIFLYFEIRAERELNIDFESMLNEIASSQAFKDKKLKLPYRQEMRSLNLERNLVQHHAHEPTPSVMDEYRIFARKFLEKVCQDCFGLDWGNISRIDMLEDPSLKSVLNLSLKSIKEKKFSKSMGLSKFAFHLASQKIVDFLPEERFLTSFFITPRGEMFEILKEPIEKLVEKIRKAEEYSALLSSGINLVDWKRFETVTSRIVINVGGYPNASEYPDLTENDTQWAHEFVLNTFLHWQTIGLTPIIPEIYKNLINKVTKDNGAILEPKPKPSKSSV